MASRLTEYPDRQEWDLSEFTLDRLCFDYRLELFFGIPKSSLTVIIVQGFTFRPGNYLVDPEIIQVEHMGLLMALLHQPVASLIAFRNGTLLIRFVNGTEIEVERYDQYESWEASGEGEIADLGMLCTPHDGSSWGS